MVTQNLKSGSLRFRILVVVVGSMITVTLFLYTVQNGSYVQVIRSGLMQARFNTTKFFAKEKTESTKHRVICMIMTVVSNWETRGKAVRNTWAERCYKFIFFYTKIGNYASHSISKEPNAVGLDVPDGRGHLTAKTLAALNYSYSKYASEADYFLKADDDTYVIMENLNRVLSKFKNTTLLYLGRKIDKLLSKGYNSGGAGYIISNGAVELMFSNASSYPKDCPRDGAIEDYDIGKCLSKFGIFPQDELDETGRLTFHSDNPLHVLQNGAVAGAYYINMSGAEFGQKKTIKTRGFMLSRRTVTMHYVSPPEMYMYDFLLYHLKRDSDVP